MLYAKKHLVLKKGIPAYLKIKKQYETKLKNGKR